MSYKINKQKCTGCQVCIANCPGATKIGTDGRAEVIDQEKLEQCGGESICPAGAIEETDKEGRTETETPSQSISQPPSYSPSPSGGRGMGRGIGAGRGRGLSRGPQDGRGQVRGGGGRR